MITDAIKAKREQDRAVRLAALRGDLSLLTSFPAIGASLPERWATLRLEADDLKAVRREFALRFHPDKLPAGERERGTRSLGVVNAAIDRAHKRLKSRRSASCATASRATSAQR